MRTERHKKKKKKRFIIQLVVLSSIILFSGLFFFQNAYSKGKEFDLEYPVNIFDKDPNRLTNYTSLNPSRDTSILNEKLSSFINSPYENSFLEKNNNPDSFEIDQDEKQKIIYLTFDDGPQDFTIYILDLLDKYEAKATFFMLEPLMRKYPDVLNEIVNRGHEVGLHSVTHSKEKFYRSKQSVLNEMYTSQLTLNDITGVTSTFIRTPYGSFPYMTEEYRKGVDEAGFIMWDWNIDSKDWALTDGSYVQNVISQIENFKKDEPMVVLLHDLQTTLDNLENLLIYLTDEGYKMDALTTEVPVVQF